MSAAIPERPPAQGRPASNGAVWFALLGGGVAWTLHLMLAYVIAEFGCLSGLGAIRAGGISIVAWMLLGLSAGALALAILATVFAARIRRRPGGDAGEEADGTEARAFGGRLGYVTNLVFTLVIAVQSVPILYYLGEC
jgi:hypothetical protein